MSFEKFNTENTEKKIVEEKPEQPENKIEKEKSPEEVLADKRREFAKMELELGKQKLSGKIIEDSEKAQEMAPIENDYRDALKNYRKELLEKIKDLPEKEREKKTKEILTETVVKEADNLYDLKTEIKLEAKGDSKIEKIKNITGKAIEKYRKLPLKYKLLLSAGLLAGGVGAGAIGGATGAALATGVITGRWFQRVFGGAATAVGLEGLIKKSQEKKEKKEVIKEFGKNILNTLEKGNAELDRKLFELESGKKTKKTRRYILAGTAGVLVGSGMIGRAARNIFNVFGVHPVEAAEIPPKAGGAMSLEEFHEQYPGLKYEEQLATAKTKLEAAIEAIPQKPSIESVIEVQKGDSVWKLAAKQLEERYGNKFTGLDEARKTYVIDAIKDKVSADPGKFGLTNVDQLNIGQKVDLSSVFEDKTDIDNIFNSADNLTQPQLENVLHNNSEILNWVKAHPHEALTSEKVEQILHPKAPEILVTETTAPELPPDLQPPFSPEVQEGIEQKIDSFSENPLEIPVDDKTMDILNSGTTEKIFENLPSEITRNIITEKIHDNFGLWSGTYDKFSDMKLKDFFNLTNENDAHYMTGTPWEDYKYHEISRVQDQAEKVFKALDTTEQDVVGKGNVESFLKKYFVKVFSK